MSFRELKDFVEILRWLGYPRLVSIESFRRPNFELVAEILYWMVKKYDPQIMIADNIDTEDDRVEFVMSITQALAGKARIRMNPRKIYEADGIAVRELLKLATVLYKAHRFSQKPVESAAVFTEAADGTTSSKSVRMQDVRVCKQLATELTEHGSHLHDLLGRETEIRQDRINSLKFIESLGLNSSISDSGQVSKVLERNVGEILESMRNQVDVLQRQVFELESDEKILDSKIKKKTEEIERGTKRLRSLEETRPPFADECSKLEEELKRYYDIYIEKFRNLNYLESQLDSMQAIEKEQQAENSRVMAAMRKKLRDEELRVLKGDGDVAPVVMNTTVSNPAVGSHHHNQTNPAMIGGSTASGQQQGGGGQGNKLSKTEPIKPPAYRAANPATRQPPQQPSRQQRDDDEDDDDDDEESGGQKRRRSSVDEENDPSDMSQDGSDDDDDDEDSDF